MRNTAFRHRKQLLPLPVQFSKRVGRCHARCRVTGRVLELLTYEMLWRRTRRGAPRRPTRRAARRAVPVAQRAYRHREQRGVDSGKAAEGSPKGCPRWRQRSHTGIDSSDNRVFCRNDPFGTRSVSKVICPSPAGVSGPRKARASPVSRPRAEPGRPRPGYCPWSSRRQ